MKSSWLDFVLFVFFTVGLTAVSFIGGAALFRYHLPPSQWLESAFQGGDAWAQKYGYADSEAPPQKPNYDAIIADSHVTWDKKTAFNGYTLLNIRYSSTAYLIDMEGHVAYKWSMPFYKAWHNPPHVPHPVSEATIGFEKTTVYPNGDLLVIYSGEYDTPWGYGMAKLDKDSKLLWTYDDNTNHDFYVDKENGNIYGLVHHLTQTPVKDAELLLYPLLEDFIVILSPEGKELKRISLIKAFVNSPYASMIAPIAGQSWDLLHTNSIMKLEPSMASGFPMFKPGQILVSMRQISALAVIDPESEKVVWAYSGLWKGQHAANFLPNGHILLLDNSSSYEKKKFFSRVLEFDPKTSSIVWDYSGSKDKRFYTRIYGRTQLLPNDNVLVDQAEQCRLFEVDRNGTIVWDYVLSDVIQSAKRYAPDELPFLKE